MEKFNEINLKTIKRIYEENLPKFYMTSIGGIIFWSGFLFIPAKLFGRKARRSGVSGNMMESLGFIPAIVFSLVLIIITILVANWILQISKLKKDLKEKKKITTTVKIIKIEKLSAKTIQAHREQGENITDCLHFEQDENEIETYLFNRFVEPNILNAKAMYIELAENSRIEFKREFINK
ncbi:hypothetical protein CW731_05595 [Polaribacter sp. ALD11]|uniref:hypothetical protein n=1 Tax=Polaribacter sp. ALD11 TaxID=2058137 RepID=UPI000C301897|nr:hypothetical protein [Polaribacter sp. ALD11]AUC84798.1 hypothetical protein CW731_05595 [Polaribacter sp. ALD11]